MLSHCGPYPSKATVNDETYRCDNNRHLTASWLAEDGRGSPKTCGSPFAEAARAGSMAAFVPEASVPE